MKQDTGFFMSEYYSTKEEILQLFKDQGVIYRKRARIGWKPLHNQKFSRSPYYKENKEEFKRLAALYGDAIEECRIAPIYIKKIDDEIGYGVFAAETIAKDDFVGEYTGVVQIGDSYKDFDDENGKGFETDFTWYYLDNIKGGPTLEINGRLEGNEMRFLNHSNEPNVEVEHTLYQGQWVLFFKAGRDIEKDEQLLISYGEAYWEDGFREMAEL